MWVANRDFLLNIMKGIRKEKGMLFSSFASILFITVPRYTLKSSCLPSAMYLFGEILESKNKSDQHHLCPLWYVSSFVSQTERIRASWVFLCSQAKYNKLGKCKSGSMRNSSLHCHLSWDIFQEVEGVIRRALRWSSVTFTFISSLPFWLWVESVNMTLSYSSPVIITVHCTFYWWPWVGQM